MSDEPDFVDIGSAYRDFHQRRIDAEHARARAQGAGCLAFLLLGLVIVFLPLWIIAITLAVGAF